jgi:hypothetical protein
MEHLKTLRATRGKSLAAIARQPRQDLNYQQNLPLKKVEDSGWHQRQFRHCCIIHSNLLYTAVIKRGDRMVAFLLVPPPEGFLDQSARHYFSRFWQIIRTELYSLRRILHEKSLKQRRLK